MAFFTVMRRLKLERRLRAHFSKATDDLIIERKNGIGVFTLNCPEEDNCLTQSMMKRMTKSLDDWKNDDNLHLVLLKATDCDYFSKGGSKDSFVRLSKEPNFAKEYFSECYKFMYKFSTSNVPTIALVNGIMSSLGATLVANCNFRIVTENAGFCLPEVTYGFIPDDGASYHLSREPGKLGFYLALTGEQISKRDLVKAGIATHFVPSAAIDSLEKSLFSQKLDHTSTIRVIGGILTKHHQQWKTDFSKEFCFRGNIGRMNIAFESRTIEEILMQLEKDRSTFARKTFEKMRNASPTSLKITLELLKRSVKSTLKSCLIREFYVSQRMVETHDFKEGIRARLIDNDNKPVWKPARPEDISNEQLASFFAPIPDSKLDFSR